MSIWRPLRNSCKAWSKPQLRISRPSARQEMRIGCHLDLGQVPGLSVYPSISWWSEARQQQAYILYLGGELMLLTNDCLYERSPHLMPASCNTLDATCLVSVFLLLVWCIHFDTTGYCKCFLEKQKSDWIFVTNIHGQIAHCTHIVIGNHLSSWYIASFEVRSWCQFWCRCWWPLVLNVK